MRPSLACISLLLLIGLLGCSLTAVSPRRITPAAVDVSRLERTTGDPLLERMTRPIQFEGIDDSHVTLQEALDHLTARYGVPFEINRNAFGENWELEIRNRQIGPKPLPRMRSVSLCVVLRRLLARLPIGSDATFTLRSDVVEITSRDAQDFEFRSSSEAGPVSPRVQGLFVRRPMEEVLATMMEQVDFNLVIDRRLGDRLSTPVTLRLRNTPLDVALLLASEDTGMVPLLLDNIVYLTSRENAEAFQRRLRRAHPPGVPAGTGALPQ